MRTLYKKVCSITDQATQKVQSVYAERVNELETLDHALDAAKHHESNNQQDALSAIDAKEFWITGIVCVGLAMLFYKAYSLIYLVIAAFIIAMAIENLILFFQRKMKRGLAIGVSYLLLLLFVLSGILVLIPFVVTQLVDLIDLVVQQVNVWQ